MFTLPAGAVPAFLGVLLILAVLIEPILIRRRLLGAALGLPARPAAAGRARYRRRRHRGRADQGSMATDKAVTARGFGKFLARRDALAIILTVVLWLVGLYLRPDYWWNLPNTFAILLNYTELALIAVGLTYVIAAGDIDLSVGAVLALAGSTAAYALKVLGLDPWSAIALGLAAGTLAGAINGALTVWLGLPAFISTLGMFYIARGVASWLVVRPAAHRLDRAATTSSAARSATFSTTSTSRIRAAVIGAVTEVVSVQTIWMVLVVRHRRDRARLHAVRPEALRDRRQHPRRRLCRHQHQPHPLHRAASSAPSARPMAGLINIAYFRSFNPVAGQFRELDGIAAVIIGGGSIFGGYGTIIGALAGAAVITLIRALLQLNVQGFTMPQHWVNVFIGVILIVAVLIDIWVRQENILGQRARVLRTRRRAAAAGNRQCLSRTRAHADRRDARASKSRSARCGRCATSISTLYPGEILGLVGDNSAGKSTLMKIMTGAYQRDSGEILVAGKPVHFKSPHESRDVGIEMIYQDFALCGNMDVGQNIFLGRWPRRGLFINRKKMYAEADQVLKRLKVDVNSVYQRVESLSGGRQQSVAIARAISFEPRVVILDEPTANLSVMATERLLETMLELKKQGVAQIIISHRLVDIFAVGDRVMVLKRGENVGDRYVKNTDEHEVLEIIVSGTRESRAFRRRGAEARGLDAAAFHPSS